MKLQINELVKLHAATINAATEANHSRTFYAHWPEAPSGKIYGESANADGLAEFQSCLNKSFSELGQKGAAESCGKEQSPYGFPLGVIYPKFDADTLVQRALDAQLSWRKFTPDERAAILLECLEQAAKHFFAIGYATMHTTGQGFIMAFQASGPHAFDRALEAIVTALEEQKKFADKADWRKPAGKTEIAVEKRYHIVPKGINVTIGCSTFPLWNSFPGIFASLTTGNTSIAKTHPGAILPMAICISSFRQTLEKIGVDPDIIQLAADDANAPLTLPLALHPDVSLIDYTGSSKFGSELERQIAGANKQIYTEKTGVNCVIIDSADNLDAVLENLAFSLSLYSGQMCTAPQNIFIPADGIASPDGIIAANGIAQKLTEKIDAIASNEKVGPGTFGAIQNEATINRINDAAALGETIRSSNSVAQAGFENARTASPLIVLVSETQNNIYEREWFGPISFIIPISSFEAAVEKTALLAKDYGALSGAIYTTDSSKMEYAEEILINVGVPVAFNFTGPIWINQSAAFSDFHGTGANPAGSASFADSGFVSTRFSIVGSRRK